MHILQTLRLKVQQSYICIYIGFSLVERRWGGDSPHTLQNFTNPPPTYKNIPLVGSPPTKLYSRPQLPLPKKSQFHTLWIHRSRSCQL